ncbi:MAG: type II toxin-antitoxin system HipA family toxin [Chitinophagales bacterium]
MVTTAKVKLWGKKVGAIAWDQSNRLGSFEYTPEFPFNNWDIAPLKMPIDHAKGSIFSFPELRDTTTFKGLPGLLADALPDKYGNAVIDAWLARTGRASGSMNPIETLCFIGKRAMGALEFEPVISDFKSGTNKIELDSLILVAQDILAGRQDFSTHLSRNEEKALLEVLKISSSAGGARAKAVIAFNTTTKEIRSGQADAPPGFEHWIIKFDGIVDDHLENTTGYGRVEMAYYLMTQDLGINMMECRLLEENGRAHFMTKRFDRIKGNGKLHVQSFCAIAHYDFNAISSYSYEQMFELLRLLRLPYPEAEQLFRRMVFNVIARNCDDHTKNFSLIMEQDGSWRLSPAFDIVHAYRPGSTWVSQHCLSINGKRENISRDDILSLAKQMNIKKPDVIIDQTSKIVSLWQDYADKVNVEPRLKDAIKSTHSLL